MRLRGLVLLLIGLGVAACSSSRPASKDPNERSASELYLLKGLEYMSTGRMDIAQQDLQRAVELDDHNAEAHNALGVLYERTKRPEEAEAEFKRALSLDDKNPAAANNYARLQCSQGKYDAAMKLFAAATASKTNTTPWLGLTNAGLCAKSSGKTQEAEGLLRKALEAKPDFAPALLEMAKLSLESHNYLSARAFLQRLEAAAEPTAESLWVGAQTEQALGNAQDANSYLKKLQKLFPDSREALRARPSHQVN